MRLALGQGWPNLRNWRPQCTVAANQLQREQVVSASTAVESSSGGGGGGGSGEGSGLRLASVGSLLWAMVHVLLWPAAVVACHGLGDGNYLHHATRQ
jgi:hypothetical protein